MKNSFPLALVCGDGQSYVTIHNKAEACEIARQIVTAAYPGADTSCLDVARHLPE